MAEYEAIIGTDDNLNVDVSTDIDVPVTVTDNGFVSMSVEPDASALSIDAEVAPDEIIDVPVQEGLGGIASDHRLLLHRDAANQHPMSAIDGLESALSGIESTLEARILDAENEITDLSLVEEADRITMANAVIRIDRSIDLLQNQVDGNITTWFYDYVPTLGNSPASDWIQAGEEAVHLGDLFYNTDTGYVYRWMSDGATPPVYSWTRITDSDVTKALADAAAAQDTADHKRRVFITTPVPPYDAGDLWFVGVSGDILTCTQGRLESEYYDAGDWSKLHKYTDDTRANEAYTLANNAKLSADGKNRIYRQNTQPTGGVYGAGDVWFDTAHDNKIYRYDGASWVAVSLGNDALDNLSANKITAGTLDASQVTVSNLDAGNITTGTLDASHIDASTLTIGGSGLATTSDIPTDVSDLNNDSGFQTSGDVSSAISTATANMLTSVTTKDQYYLSTSDASATGGSWQDTVPTWSTGKYIWTRVATTKTNSNGSTTSYSTGVYDGALTSALATASSAQTSANGAAASVVTTKQYYLSTSDSSATGGSWQDTVPTWTSGKYIWVRFKIVTTPVSGTATTSYTPSASGTYDSALTNAPTMATDYITKIDSNGIYISPSSQSPSSGSEGNSVKINGDGMEVYKGGTSVAKYGDTARIGKTGSGHTTIQASGMQIYGNDGTVELANIGYGSGNAQAGGTANAPYYTIGTRKTGSGIGNYSVAEGNDTIASGFGSHAEGGTRTVTSGGVTTVYNTTASGVSSHAEGAGATASGTASHAEGNTTTASGAYSHAEGYVTTASGESAHAEGSSTTASKRDSHAEGDSTTASGVASHAEGYSTIASSTYQHVQGKYNVADASSVYADIVGGGTSANTRANISALTWTGDLRLKGDVYVGCNDDSTGGTLLGVNLNAGDISGTSQSAFETNLLARLSALGDGEIRMASVYPNYSGSFTDGARSPAVLYRYSSGIYKCEILSPKAWEGYYYSNAWHWNSVIDTLNTRTNVQNGNALTSFDLNNLTETACYQFDKLTSAMTNAPNTGTYFSGFLFVERYASNKVLQTFYHTGGESAIYVRSLWNGTWGSWYKMPTRSEVNALNNIAIVRTADNETQAQWRTIGSGTQIWFTYNKTQKVLYANLYVNGEFVGTNKGIASW